MHLWSIDYLLRQATGNRVQQEEIRGRCTDGPHLLSRETKWDIPATNKKHVKGLGNNPSKGTKSTILDKVVKGSLS